MKEENQISKPAFRRHFSDYFSKQFKISLALNGNEIIGSGSEQLNGLSVSDSFISENQDESWIDSSGGIRADIQSKLQELHPRSLRFSAMDKNFPVWFCFSRENHIPPQIVLKDDLEWIDSHLLQIKMDYSTSATEDSGIRWEIRMPEAVIDDGTEQVLNAEAAKVGQIARRIRELDPESVIILPCIPPGWRFAGRALVWNEKILKTDRKDYDWVGINWFPDDPTNWINGNPMLALEAAYGLAADFEMVLRRFSEQIASYCGGDIVPKISIGAWGYPMRNFSKQDAFFYASVFQTILRSKSLVAASHAGWLAGLLPFIEYDAEKSWITAPGQFFASLHPLQEVQLNLRPFDEKENLMLPWQGIPGISEPRDLPAVIGSASRSADGKKVFLSILNRNPYRRALVRISLLNLPEMKPIEAKVVRAKNRLDFNDSTHPNAVECVKIPLRSYRTMDHVNLDISPVGAATMLLTVQD